MTGKDCEGRMERAYKLGFRFEREYGSCPQCVFAAVSEVLGMDGCETFKAIDGLAGGLARSGNGTCGALSGGVAAISRRYGREEFPNLGERERCMTLAKKLHDKFMAEYGSILCKDIQTKILGRSYNFWDPKDREEFDRAGGHTDKCPDVVGKAAKWTVEILLGELE
ncbi:C_GCAxxG_C_C family protein [Candidatus Bathyarchaeota archaeon]|nr:C_GCAxxG_C_C family protein [Candidatus Bathyarchaeota archaeon]